MNQEGVFINGRAQIVEMFKLLNPSEKDRLLSVIKLRNPALATELMQETLSFDSLENLNDQALLMLSERIKPTIWGLALKGSAKSLQRKILSLMPRASAQQAFNILQTQVDNEKVTNQRAQKKILDTLLYLKKTNLI
ncbi:hypothetical protein N9O57_00645 [bacterium]|nr:hypothetical protein [bacterium]